MSKFKNAWSEFWKAQHRKAYTHSEEAYRHGNIVQEQLRKQARDKL